MVFSLCRELCDLDVCMDQNIIFIVLVLKTSGYPDREPLTRGVTRADSTAIVSMANVITVDVLGLGMGYG